MDFADYGADAEELFRQQALATQKALARLVNRPAGESAKWCEGPACGARIPEARRRAVPGARFCVECQQIEEQKGARR